jgi:hypothetical protein
MVLALPSQLIRALQVAVMEAGVTPVISTV